MCGVLYRRKEGERGHNITSRKVWDREKGSGKVHEIRIGKVV